MQTFNFHLPKHELLLRFATAAKILSWICLAYYLLLLFITVMPAIYPIDEFGMKPDKPVITIKEIFPPLKHLLSGIVTWVVLRSIALGLAMIVETDWNYRLRREENDHAG